MITIIEGMPRPSAIEAGPGYRSLRFEPDGDAQVTEYRVGMVGHEPCGWTHPTWPDEAAGRLAAHKMTCELRVEGEEL